MGHKMQFCPLSILLFKFYFYKPVNAFSSIIKLEQVKKKIDRFILSNKALFAEAEEIYKKAKEKKIDCE